MASAASSGNAPAGDLPILAGLGRRVGALAYELLLAAALVLVAGFALAPFVSPQPRGEPHQLIVPGAIARAGGFIALFTLLGAYFVWSWTGARRTLAQKTWRLALRDRDGLPLTRRRASLRYLAAWIGPALALLAFLLLRPQGLGPHAVWLVALGWLWALVDPERQFLHDRVAGTRIVAVKQ